jgi:hypothetical protein
MEKTLSTLIERFHKGTLSRSKVIPWSCPVPSFGDPSRSRVATLGLNPSNREFVDDAGEELDGEERRFHTLKSLGLCCWSEADEEHLDLIAESCHSYFSRNPYDRWFKKLDDLISGTQASYYGTFLSACHLDLIPYATECKWTDLTREQKSALLCASGDALALMLKESRIELLILNGSAVVEHFEQIAGVKLKKTAKTSWSLPRQSGTDVIGFAFTGVVHCLSGIALDRKVTVLGFNHNIQSSFGVTRKVTSAIRQWITEAGREALG